MSLPKMVADELAMMPAHKQSYFWAEYKRKDRSLLFGYLLFFCFGLHYAYVGKWGYQALYWITAGGALVWAIIDLFRMPSIISNYNKDVAVQTMINVKAMS